LVPTADISFYKLISPRKQLCLTRKRRLPRPLKDHLRTATNPPAATPTTLAIDERFASLAADLMSQFDAKLETFRQEIATQLGLNVDPLHKDLHDLLDQQMQAAAKIEALEAANFVTPEDLHRQAEQMGDAIAEKFAPKMAPVIQPAINVVDPTIADRLTKIESKLRFF
jgi:hypothetical protein